MKCENCKWWIKIEGWRSAGNQYGECRGAPPTAASGSHKEYYGTGEFPLTYGDTFCGMFQQESE
jgi:hypothetical protein